MNLTQASSCICSRGTLKEGTLALTAVALPLATGILVRGGTLWLAQMWFLPPSKGLVPALQLQLVVPLPPLPHGSLGLQSLSHALNSQGWECQGLLLEEGKFPRRTSQWLPTLWGLSPEEKQGKALQLGTVGVLQASSKTQAAEGACPPPAFCILLVYIYPFPNQDP